MNRRVLRHLIVNDRIPRRRGDEPPTPMMPTIPAPNSPQARG